MQAYLDNSATTPLCSEAKRWMRRAMDDCWGNPSSLHEIGLRAEALLEESRAAVAKALRCKPAELRFTSGGTEANNLAVFGAAKAGRNPGRCVLVSAVEHPSVMKAAEQLAREGFALRLIPVDRFGNVSLDAFRRLLTDDTVLVSVMAVNNELGAIEPVREIAAELKARGSRALFHVDAVQAFGKLPVLPGRMKIDMLSVSAHKIHGPKGIGGLYVREGVRIPSFVFGGGQESGFRSGTENMVGIVGFGEAARELTERGAEKIRRMAEVRNYLRDGLLAEIPDIAVNGPFETGGEPGLAAPSVLNVSFLGCRGEVLLHTLEQKEIYVSTGSACSSNSKQKGSHVLRAAGLSPERIEGALRFSFSGDNTVAEMDIVIAELKKAVGLMRKLTHR